MEATTKTVRELLDDKGHEVWTIGPDDSVYDALRGMSDKQVGALVVVHEGKVVGVISERDYARKVILLERSSRDTRVDEIMTPDPTCVRLDTPVDECLKIMTDGRFRHLPVLDAGRLVGVVSIGDAVKAKLSAQRFVIEQLEQYITGQ